MGLAAWAGEAPSRSTALRRAGRRARRARRIRRVRAPGGHGRGRGVGQAGRARGDGAGRGAGDDHGRATATRSIPSARPDDLFTRVMAHWDDVDEPARTTGIARDVILVHLASMSNLFAASGGCSASSCCTPTCSTGYERGDAGLLERCALESTRLGQRSVMLRAVLAPCDVRDEHHTYRVAPGAQIATLLPLTNTTAAPGLDTLRPRSVEPPPPARRRRAPCPRAGHHVRPRRAHLSGAAVLARRHVPRRRNACSRATTSSRPPASPPSPRSRCRSAASPAASTRARSATGPAEPGTLHR